MFEPKNITEKFKEDIIEIDHGLDINFVRSDTFVYGDKIYLVESNKLYRYKNQDITTLILDRFKSLYKDNKIFIRGIYSIGTMGEIELLSVKFTVNPTQNYTRTKTRQGAADYLSKKYNFIPVEEAKESGGFCILGDLDILDKINGIKGNPVIFIICEFVEKSPIYSKEIL